MSEIMLLFLISGQLQILIVGSSWDHSNAFKGNMIPNYKLQIQACGP